MKFKITTIIILMIFCISCKTNSTHIYDYQWNMFSINDSLNASSDVKNIIAPYKQELNEVMKRPLAYTNIELHKRGFNSPLANWAADMILEESRLMDDEEIDFCVLNHGGLRRPFQPGMLSVSDIFELMPFENEVVVVTLNEQQLKELIQYFWESSKGHPLAGIEIKSELDYSFSNSDGKIRVATSDYLQKGGDHMTFFQDAPAKKLQAKIRTLMIKHLDKVDTIHVNLNQRIYR